MKLYEMDFTQPLWAWQPDYAVDVYECGKPCWGNAGVKAPDVRDPLIKTVVTCHCGKVMRFIRTEQPAIPTLLSSMKGE